MTHRISTWIFKWGRWRQRRGYKGAVKGTQARGSQGAHNLSPFKLLHEKSHQINIVHMNSSFFVNLYQKTKTMQQDSMTRVSPWWPGVVSGRSLTPSCCRGHPPSDHRARGSWPGARPWPRSPGREWSWGCENAGCRGFQCTWSCFLQGTTHIFFFFSLC